LKHSKSRFGYLFLTSQVEATRKPHRWVTHKAVGAASREGDPYAVTRVLALAGLLALLAAVYFGWL
jgi:hypothetical protein